MDALREIHKKLVPGGSLGLLWNIEDCSFGRYIHIWKAC